MEHISIQRKFQQWIIEIVMNQGKVEKLLDAILLEENKHNHLETHLIIEEFTDLCSSYTENNSIYLKKSLLENVDYSSNIKKKNNIYYLIKNIYHEIMHIRQSQEAKQGILSDNSLFYITTNFIHDYLDPEEYVRNYAYQEIELLANRFAWKKVHTLLEKEKFFQDTISNIEEEEKHLEWVELYLKRFTRNKQVISVWKTFPHNLNQVIQNHSYLLNSYPILNYFYYMDGTPKSLLLILEEIPLADFYQTARLWISRRFFLEIITLNIYELKYHSFQVKNDYLELFQKIVVDYVTAVSRFKEISMEHDQVMIEEYEKTSMLIISKIEELEKNNLLNHEVLFDYKEKLYDILGE